MKSENQPRGEFQAGAMRVGTERSRSKGKEEAGMSKVKNVSNGNSIGSWLLQSDWDIMRVWKRFFCSEAKNFASNH